MTARKAILKKLRQKRRAGRSLEERAVTQSTLSRYYAAVGLVLHLVEQARTAFEMDDLIACWVQEVFAEGEAMGTVGDALSALHFFIPWTKYKLPSAWRLFRVWKKTEVPAQAPPLPVAFVLAMAARSFEKEDLTMGTLLLVGFHCMLRTGELLLLTPRHILLGDSDAVLQLGFTKTGLRFHRKEHVSVQDNRVLTCLKVLLQWKQCCSELELPLWTHSPQKFRDEFRQLTDYFQISHLGFRPYSLRRGGATHDFRIHGSMERALVRGRWNSSGAARNYLHEGVSVLTELRVSPRISARIWKYVTAI